MSPVLPFAPWQTFVTHYVTKLRHATLPVLGMFVTYCVTNLPAAHAAVPWTLENAIAVALENSPDARVARHRLAGAEALVQQARANAMPQVSLSGGYTLTNSPMMAFGSILNQRAFDFGLDFNEPGTIDNLNATATVGINLYSGGQVTSGIRAARAGVAAAAFDEQAARHALIAATIAAYLNITKAVEAVGAVEAGERAYEAAVANARARFEAGQMLKADLLSLEVQLAQTRENRIAARHAEALAQRAFLFVLGVKADGEPVEVATGDPALAALQPPTEEDFSQRAELLGLQERVTAAEAMLRAARGARHPTVKAFGGVQYDRGWETGESGDSWMAGIAVDFKIFDGGTTSGKIREAEAQLDQVREMQRKAELGIELEVEQARLAHAEARERLAVSAAAVEQAAESATLSRARFREGALVVADLIGVEGRLIEARMRRAVAEADERLALVQWRRALGLTPLEIESALN